MDVDNGLGGFPVGQLGEEHLGSMCLEPDCSSQLFPVRI